MILLWTALTLIVGFVAFVVLDEALGTAGEPRQAVVVSKRFVPGTVSHIALPGPTVAPPNVPDLYMVRLDIGGSQIELITSQEFYHGAVPGKVFEVVLARGRFSKRLWIKKIREAG